MCARVSRPVRRLEITWLFVLRLDPAWDSHNFLRYLICTCVIVVICKVTLLALGVGRVREIVMKIWKLFAIHIRLGADNRLGMF